MNFRDRLDQAFDRHDSLLCVGLDPDPARFPAVVGGGDGDIERFCTAIIEATADLVCAFKPQIAYFAACGAEAALERVIEVIRDRAPHALVILDAKRGDIGSTAERYAVEAFDRYGADAVTVNPYLGSDTLEPFLARPDRGAVVLCRTSNPGSAEFQGATDDPEPLFERIARSASEHWNARENVMLVAGATHPDELARIRALAPTVPLLVPGIGAQGGDVEAVVRAGVDARGRGLLLNSARAVLYASSGDDFAAAARAEAERTNDAICAALQSLPQADRRA